MSKQKAPNKIHENVKHTKTSAIAMKVSLVRNTGRNKKIFFDFRIIVFFLKILNDLARKFKAEIFSCLLSSVLIM